MSSWIVKQLPLTGRSFHSESEDKFIFHIQILEDKQLISGLGEDDSLGITNAHDKYYVSVVPWRLTADGHDFAIALTKPSILSTIKDKFQKEGFSAVIDVTKTLAIKHAEKLLDV